MTSEDEQSLRAEAEAAGLDPDATVAAAKRLESAGESDAKPAKPGTAVDPTGPEQPKLFQYHLPFVTVREVRAKWLGLTDPFAGDSEIAAVWAAKNGGDGGGTPPPAAAPA